MASVCDSYCKNCIYVGKASWHTLCCRYVFVEDKLRPCPAGTGCTVKMTDQEVKRRAAAAKKANDIERKAIIAQKKRENYAKKRAERRKFCRYCGKEFMPTKERHFFCCSECATKYTDENNRRRNHERWIKRKAAMKEAKEAKR